MTQNPERPATVQEHQHALQKLLQEFDRVCRALSIPYVLFAGTLLGAVRHQGFIPWDDDVDVMMLRPDYDRFLREAPDVLNRDEFYLQGEFSDHWPMFFSKLRLNNTACLEKYHPRDKQAHQGVFMDIFPCDNARSTALGRRLQFYASKVVIAKGLYGRGYDTDSRKKKLFMALCRLLPMAPFLKLTQSGPGDSPVVHSFLGAACDYEKNVYPREFFLDRTHMAFAQGTYPVPRQYDALLRQLYGDYMQIPPPEQRICKQHVILVDLNNSYEMYRDYRDDIKFEVFTRSIR